MFIKYTLLIYLLVCLSQWNMIMEHDQTGCVPFGACSIWRLYHLARVPFGACAIWRVYHLALHKTKTIF
jgi:hypothetical protein